MKRMASVILEIMSLKPSGPQIKTHYTPPPPPILISVLPPFSWLLPHVFRSLFCAAIISLSLFFDYRTEETVGSCQTEESHVQTQVLDEQGGTHSFLVFHQFFG